MQKKSNQNYFIYKLDTTKQKLCDELPNKLVDVAVSQIFRKLRASKDFQPHYLGFIDQNFAFSDMEWVNLMLNPDITPK